MEWAEIIGPASGRKVDYVEHYAPLDLYLPALRTLQSPRWISLSDSVPEPVRLTSEWYQDFIRPSGIADALGIQVHHAGPRRVFFGVHYEKLAGTLPESDERLQQLLAPLQEAAERGQVQRMFNLKESLGKWTVEHLGDALLVATVTGRVIDMNAAADGILGGSYALAVRDGKLTAIDSAEAARLAALIAAPTDAGPRRMLLGGPDHQQHCQLVSVYPLEHEWTKDEPAMVVIRVVDLLARPSSAAGLADLFGLSPAEDRLAQALLQGKTLQALTREFRVQMPTLRAQVRSVLRKCGVQRQVDLMRVLLRIQ